MELAERLLLTYSLCVPQALTIMRANTLLHTECSGELHLERARNWPCFLNPRGLRSKLRLFLLGTILGGCGPLVAATNDIEITTGGGTFYTTSSYGDDTWTGELQANPVSKRLLYFRNQVQTTTNLSSGATAQRLSDTTLVKVTLDFTLSGPISLDSVQGQLSPSPGTQTAIAHAQAAGDGKPVIRNYLPVHDEGDVTGFAWSHAASQASPPNATKNSWGYLSDSFAFTPKPNGFTVTYTVRASALSVSSGTGGVATSGHATSEVIFKAYLPDALDPDPTKRQFTLQIHAAEFNTEGTTQDFAFLPDPNSASGNPTFGEVPDGSFIGVPARYGYRYAAGGGALFERIAALPTGIDTDDQFVVFANGQNLGSFSGGSAVNFATLIGSPVAAFAVKGYTRLGAPLELDHFPLAVDLDTGTATVVAEPLPLPSLDPATLTPGGTLDWSTEPELEYLFQWTDNLMNWNDLGSWTQGTGSMMSGSDDPLRGSVRLYRTLTR